MLSAVLTRMLLVVLLSPLLAGVVGKTKAFFAGRTGPSLWQPYLDMLKLVQRGAVYSASTTWIFRAAPLVSLAAVLASSLVLPLGAQKAPVEFAGDAILFFYLYGLARFFTVLAALDTGSSFEGMGASRELTFSALAEPTLFVNLVILAVSSKSLSLAGMLGGWRLHSWAAGPSFLLVATSFFLVLLCENSRIPVDDPATHLELTMIHEVMILDHGGPDLALIQAASASKLFVLGSFLVSVFLPTHSGGAAADAAMFLGAMLGMAVLIGVVESSMARLRMDRVPILLTVAFVFSVIGLAVTLMEGTL